jgi:hypothetical protein
MKTPSYFQGACLPNRKDRVSFQYHKSCRSRATHPFQLNFEYTRCSADTTNFKTVFKKALIAPTQLNSDNTNTILTILRYNSPSILVEQPYF